jgi:hypothetical protein
MAWHDMTRVGTLGMDMTYFTNLNIHASAFLNNIYHLVESWRNPYKN